MPTATQNAALASSLRISVMRLTRRLRNTSADSTLSLSELATLGTLARKGPLTPRELADCERVQPPSMTRILSSLLGTGLIERTPHPTDGRQVLVSLTARAREIIREDRRRRDEWLSRRLAEFSREERDILNAAAPLLERLAES
jgi:DNA-binding MarR family transcriptional regulator